MRLSITRRDDVVSTIRAHMIATGDCTTLLTLYVLALAAVCCMLELQLIIHKELQVQNQDQVLVRSRVAVAGTGGPPVR